MNYTNPQDHQSKAQRNIKVIKKFKVTLYRTGYVTIPKTMIKALAELSAERLNYFPVKHGLSLYYSPENIVTKKVLDCNKHYKYEFREYVQAHHWNNKANDMKGRTIDAIYLRPNDNKQGGHVLMNLNTRERIIR